MSPYLLCCDATDGPGAGDAPCALLAPHAGQHVDNWGRRWPAITVDDKINDAQKRISLMLVDIQRLEERVDALEGVVQP